MDNPNAEVAEQPVAPAEASPTEGAIIDGIDFGELSLFKNDEAPKTEEQPAEVAPQTPAEPEKKPEEPKPAESKSAEFLRLAKMEKANRESQARIKELEAQLAGAKPVELNEANFWQVAAERGIAPQKLIDQLVKGEKEPPKAKTQAELETEKLKQEVAELRKRTEEREAAEKAARAQAATAQALQEIRGDIEKAAEELPFVAAYAEDAADNIWAAMTQHYQQTGEAMDPMEAARKLNDYYRARHEKAQAALTVKKPSATMPSSSSHQQTASRPPASGPKTLTNRAATSAAPAPRKTPQTDEEREAEAVAALKFL